MERRDPGFLKLLLPFLGTGSVNERLKRINSCQSMRISSAVVPFPFILRTRSRASAAPTRTFFGSHPRSAHVPAERPRIDHCHLPSSRSAPRCHSRCGFPGSDNNNVKFSRHANHLTVAQCSMSLSRVCACATVSTWRPFPPETDTRRPPWLSPRHPYSSSHRQR